MCARDRSLLHPNLNWRHVEAIRGIKISGLAGLWFSRIYIQPSCWIRADNISYFYKSRTRLFFRKWISSQTSFQIALPASLKLVLAQREDMLATPSYALVTLSRALDEELELVWLAAGFTLHHRLEKSWRGCWTRCWKRCDQLWR